MKNRIQYYKALENEILNDPANQGYDEIFRAKYKNPRDKFTKIAEKINLNRVVALSFPIVRTNIVELIMRNE